ncbi:D-arabinono-1,4-lactone oxidase [Ruania albidiflava]|uniref:D-arabinono-1,4-lactone oxidase n=1 Tax=Ruania albidiflava TaxID=366586 RepID=UPI0003B495BD|nr:D-arabinono-1,4-lactone oxidase [Ruania albidiflava]
MTETNWAGCYTYTAQRLHQPDTVSAAQRIIAEATRIRALGSRHSFNDLADSDGDLISLAALPADIHVDADAQVVSVAGGVRYGDLAAALDRSGWALAAMASLPHIAVAGAIATATHGSGDRVGNLASAVVGLELISAEGDLLTLDEDHPDLPGAVVHLGALGVVTRVRLRIEPSYQVAQYVINDVPWEHALGHFDELTAAAYSVSLFTRWDADVVDQVWLKSRTGQVSLPVGVAATAAQHPIRGIDPTFATDQLGVAGPWFDRLPHFRLQFTPSAGEEIQAEYLVPRKHAVAAIDALRGVAAQLAPLLQVCEVRTIAADELWLSMAQGQDTVALHFTFDRRPEEVRALLPLLEETLHRFQARPHWGKWFTVGADRLVELYPRIEDFRDLARRYDSGGKFHNTFLQRTVLPR